MFDELLSGGSTAPDELREQAARVGYLLGDAHSVMVLSIQGPRRDRQTSSRERAVAREVAAAVSRVEIGSCHPMGDTRGTNVFAIVRVPFGVSAAAVRNLLASGVAQVDTSGVVAVGGLGTVETGLEGISLSYRRALAAMRAARSLGNRDLISTYLEMIPVLLLRRDRELVADLERSTIEPLSRWDAENEGHLVETLSAFLAEAGNHSAAAKRLFIHRHSIPSRLAKIESLTGMNLNRRDDLLLLELGLRAHQIITVGEAVSDDDPLGVQALDL